MISQSMPGEQNLFIPISLYFTLTLSPNVNDIKSFILTINVFIEIHAAAWFYAELLMEG
jgi:hypothetical protein